MTDIVVLAGMTPWSVLSLCRIAHQYKCNAFVVCINFDGRKLYERYACVTNVYNVTDNTLLRFVSDFVAAQGFKEKPILFMANDTACRIVVTHRDFFERYFFVSAPSSRILDTFTEKEKADVEARKSGLTVPLTCVVQSRADLDWILQQFTFPVILKPRNSAATQAVGFKFKICNREEIVGEVRKIIDQGLRVICQEYVPGEDAACKFFIFYRNAQGCIRECMGEKTLQTNGIMTIGTVKIDRELAKICREFLARIDYVGIGGMEFKKCNSQYYFIEMSTRTEGFLSISDIANCSIAEAAYNDINHQVVDWKKRAEKGRYVVLWTLLVSRLSQKQYKQLLIDCWRLAFSKHTRFVDLTAFPSIAWQTFRTKVLSLCRSR